MLSSPMATMPNGARSYSSELTEHKAESKSDWSKSRLDASMATGSGGGDLMVEATFERWWPGVVILR